MFSRAKRVAGEKGRRLDETEWVIKKGDGRKGGRKVKETIKVVDPTEDGEDKLLDQLMDEAVERGYGSDGDVKG